MTSPTNSHNEMSSRNTEPRTEEDGDLAGLGITVPSSSVTVPANNTTSFGKFTFAGFLPPPPENTQPLPIPPASPRPSFAVLNFDTFPPPSPPSLSPPSPSVTPTQYPPPTAQELAAQHLREQRFSLLIAPHPDPRKADVNKIRFDLIASRMGSYIGRLLGTPETLNQPTGHLFLKKAPRGAWRDPVREPKQRDEQRLRVGSLKRLTGDAEAPDYLIRKRFSLNAREAAEKERRDRAERREREDAERWERQLRQGAELYQSMREDREVAGGWEFEPPSPVEGEFGAGGEEGYDDGYEEEDEERARLLDQGQEDAVAVDHSRGVVVAERLRGVVEDKDSSEEEERGRARVSDRSDAVSRCGNIPQTDGSSDEGEEDAIVGVSVKLLLQYINGEESPVRSISKRSRIPRLRAGAWNVVDSTARAWKAVGGRYHLVRKITRIPRLKRNATSQSRQGIRKTTRLRPVARAHITTFASSTRASRSKTTFLRHRSRRNPTNSTTMAAASPPEPEAPIASILSRRERNAPGRPRSKIARWTGQPSGLARPRADGPRGWITERHGVRWSGGRIPRRERS